MAHSEVLERDVADLPVRHVLTGERCDRCCAPAAVHVVVRSGLDLVFCGHHAREYELQLRRSGALMRVDREFAALYW